MKHYRRTMAMLLIVVLLFACVPFHAAAADDVQTMTTNGDVVLVLDDTGSMKTNDPQKAAKQAIEQFMMANSVNGSNIGVVTFSDTVMAKYGMKKLDASTRETVEKEMKAFAAKNITWGGDWTDLVVGLKEAVNMLSGLKESDNVQAIIAVTDGANDFGKKSNRTEEISNKELAEIEKICVEKGIKIYLIGLNLDQSSVQAYLNGIAGVTGGKVEFVSTAKELGNKISEFYVDMGILTNDGPVNVPVPPEGADKKYTIEENVFEAIFDIEHSKPISVSVTDPHGNVLGSDRMSISTSDFKTLVKLREPESGEYILHINNIDNGTQTVTLSTFLNKEVYVDVSAPASVEANTDFTVSAALVRDTVRYGKDDLQYMKAELVMTSGSNTVTQAMTLNGDQFEATTQLPDGGDWDVTVSIVSDKGFNRSNDTPVTIHVEAAVVPTVPAPTTPAPAPATSVMDYLWLIILAAVVIIAVVVFSIIYFSQPQITDISMDSLRITCSTGKRQYWDFHPSLRTIFRDRNARKNGVSLWSVVENLQRLSTRPVEITTAQADRLKQIDIILRKVVVQRTGDNRRYEVILVDNGRPCSSLTNCFAVNSDDNCTIETRTEHT